MESDGKLHTSQELDITSPLKGAYDALEAARQEEMSAMQKIDGETCLCASTNCWDEEKFAPKLASMFQPQTGIKLASKLAASNAGVPGAFSRTARGVQVVSCANCLTIYMPDSDFCRKCGVARPTDPQEPDEHSSSTIEMGNPIEQFDIDVKPEITPTNNTSNSSATVHPE